MTRRGTTIPARLRHHLLVAAVVAGLVPWFAPAVSAAEPAVPVASPTTPVNVTLEPVADAFVARADPTTNFGALDYMDVYGGTAPGCVVPTGPTYGLLKFDLSSLPAGAQVTGATLRMTSRAGFAQDGDGNHHIIDLANTAWDEHTVTWVNRPDDGTAAWAGSAPAGDPTLRSGGDIRQSPAALGSSFTFRATCGGDFQGDEQHVFPSNDVDASRSLVDAERDFVGAVERARARSTGLLSLEVFNPAGPQNKAYWARWYSREATAGLRPSLTVTFTDARMMQAVPNGTQTVVTARVAGQPSTTYSLAFQTSDACSDGRVVQPVPLGTTNVTTDGSGTAYVTATIAAPARQYVSGYVSGPVGELTALSRCVVVGPDNDSWTRALPIPLAGTGSTVSGSSSGFIDTRGTSRWYRFAVQPGSTVRVRLTNLPADYDLALFRDIGQTFSRLNSLQDLNRLSAVFSPSVFSPSVFSPSVFSPSVFSPSVFSPSVFSPSVFSPSVFSPSVFSPSVFSPSVFSPSGLSPSVFSPDTFASSQTRSLIAASTNLGTADESIGADTWLATGSFYMRVDGHNGASSTAAPFSVIVARDDVPDCVGVAPIAGTPAGVAGGYHTVIVHDAARASSATPGNSAAQKATMLARLGTLAARPEVAGVVVDLGTDARLQALRAQADAHPDCPYATNLVASAIKDIVDAFRPGNDLRYVVLVGSDAAVPFFRYPDQGLLGPESDYVPPVRDRTSSQASLRLDYVLGQDEYGASTTLNLGEGNLPVPDLAVGRLVENAAEITGLLDAYLATARGVVPTPTRSLVTGYDFLSDAATSVADDLAAGTGAGSTVDRLIAPNNISPLDPTSWTADALRVPLFGSRHDLMFLAGHFSANSALAADFSTSVLSTELAASTVDLTNSIVFSAGCHSGYNIVDGDAVPGVTQTLDWAEAFAAKRATLVAGTGYQYGDTDFLEYSERIYAGLSRQLRTGTGPVSVGQALVRSKLAYLSATPDVRGLHRKALLESALFGLPMLSVDLPAGRLPADSDPSTVVATSPLTTDPGLTLGLSFADASIAPRLTPHMVALANLTGGTVAATYYEGDDGVVVNPAEPAVPLVDRNVTVPGKVLRGVAFRGGTYTDQTVVPLTGAATTELRGVHAPFTSSAFFPLHLATANYYDNFAGGATRLLVTPAQHRTEHVGDIASVVRLYQDVDVRLYYSSNLDGPALSAPPSLAGVAASVDGADIVFRADVVGNPAAGVQEAWVTYTGDGASRWASLDLHQCVVTSAQPTLPAGCGTEESTRWVGRLAGAAPVSSGLRFVAQAANGIGLVGADDNRGNYYQVGRATTTQPAAPTSISLNSTGSSGAYGSSAAVTATLMSGGQPAVGQTVVFSLGGASLAGVTGNDGVARVSLPLNAVPGDYQLSTTFGGDDVFAGSSTMTPFTVTKSPTTLTISQTPPLAGPKGIDTGVSVTLRDGNGGALIERAVYVQLDGPGAQRLVVPVITDFLGRAHLGPIALAAGTWTLTARFLGIVPLPGGLTTILTDQTYLPSSASTTFTLTGPQVSITTPSSDATYALGAVVPAAYACSPGTGSTRIVSCVGPVAPAAPIDTASIGAKTFTVTAMDGAANTASRTVTYRVVPTVTLGPIGTDGIGRVTPGSVVRLGYAFRFKSTHAAAQIGVIGPRVVIGFFCGSTPVRVGSTTVPIADGSYSVRANDTSWVPSSDQNAPSTYQGTYVLPDLCHGAPAWIAVLAFVTSVTSNLAAAPIDVRWHWATPAGKGAWSTTTTVLPVV